jgi:hypothetical protein
MQCSHHKGNILYFLQAMLLPWMISNRIALSLLIMLRIKLKSEPKHSEMLVIRIDTNVSYKYIFQLVIQMYQICDDIINLIFVQQLTYLNF